MSMARLILSNAFSVNMIAPGSNKVQLDVTEVSREEFVRSIKQMFNDGVEVLSIIGHQATAEVLS